MSRSTPEYLQPRTGGCRRFFILNYGIALLLSLQFLLSIPVEGFRSLLMALAIWLTYAFIYLVPAMLITWLAGRAGRVLRGRGTPSKAGLALWVIAVSLSQLYLFADYQIYVNWGFHINGFVLNLATTPGGIESLGASSSTFLTLAVLSSLFVVLEGILAWLSVSRFEWSLSPKFSRNGLLLLLFLSVSERINFGLGFLQADQPTMRVAEAFPLYSKLTFRSLAEKLGIEYERRNSLNASGINGSFDYPKNPIKASEPAQRYNLVWLVSESLRADSLSPEVMPNAWAFSSSNLRFMNHYSGGNCTRMGIFSLFYGIYGSYWFPALDQRKGPVFFDVLHDADYQIDVNTSAKFTYPEFDRTAFVSIDMAAMHQWNDGETWQRDRTHVDHLVSFIKGRDTSKPFMTFSFFESPHARYTFPEESVIRTPYLEDFNYATMSLEDDIELIRNRYLNSCHHLDGQLQRVFECLESEGLLDNTIVVVTGDHGEEFMEKGRWGHGSTFVEEQIRVPMILHIPGQEQQIVDRITSHLDLMPTLLPLLGVNNPVSDYSSGISLLGDKSSDQQVIADWARLCVRTPDYKAVLPLKGKALMGTQVTLSNDAPSGPEADERLLPALTTALKELGRFRNSRK